MPQTTIINKFGKIAGWNAISLRLYNRNVEGMNELEYNDKQEKNNEYGSGKFPLGQSEGNYETDACSVSFYMEELIAMQQALPAGSRIQDSPPTDVVVQYEYNGTFYKDIWRNASPRNNGRASKNGEGKIVTKIDFLVSHIDWNVQ